MAIRFDKATFADALIKIIARRAGSTLLNDINDLREAFGYQRVEAPRTTEDQTRDLLIAALADAYPLRSRPRASAVSRSSAA